MKFINEFKEGERFDGELLLTNVIKGVSNNGMPQKMIVPLLKWAMFFILSGMLLNIVVLCK